MFSFAFKSPRFPPGWGEAAAALRPVLLKFLFHTHAVRPVGRPGTVCGHHGEAVSRLKPPWRAEPRVCFPFLRGFSFQLDSRSGLRCSTFCETLGPTRFLNFYLFKLCTRALLQVMAAGACAKQERYTHRALHGRTGHFPHRVLPPGPSAPLAMVLRDGCECTG